MIITITNKATQNKKPASFLFPLSNDLTPFNKNMDTKNVCVISKAILACKLVEVELFINTQIAGNIAKTERIIRTSLKYLEFIMLKKFLLPFQNMARADLFSGSLAVWNALGFAIHFARPPNPSLALRGEERIPFELFQEYTASWENANLKRSVRGAKRAARTGFERAFLAKRKRIYQ